MAEGYIMRRGGASGGSGGGGGERVSGTFTGDGTLTTVIPELAGKTAFVIYLDGTSTGNSSVAILALTYTAAGAYCVISTVQNGKLFAQGYSSVGGSEHSPFEMSFDAGTGKLHASNPLMTGFSSGATYRFESIE